MATSLQLAMDNSGALTSINEVLAQLDRVQARLADINGGMGGGAAGGGTAASMGASGAASATAAPGSTTGLPSSGLAQSVAQSQAGAAPAAAPGPSSSFAATASAGVGGYVGDPADVSAYQAYIRQFPGMSAGANAQVAAGLGLTPAGAGGSGGGGSGAGGGMSPLMARWAAMTAIGGAVEGADRYMQYQTQRTLHGSSDPMAAGSGIGGAVGFGVGGGIGFAIGGPIGFAIGAAAGTAVGSAAGQWAMAGRESQRQGALALEPFLGALSPEERGAGSSIMPGIGPYSTLGMTAYLGSYRAGMTADETYKANKAGGMPEALARGDTGESAASLAGYMEALSAGGIDPLMPTRYKDMRLDAARGEFALAREYGTPGRGGSALVRVLAATALGALDMLGSGQETLSEFLQRRTEQVFGAKIAPDIEKRVAPIIATLPETGGGNLADVLGQYGPTATEQALQVITAPGAPAPPSITQLWDWSTGTRDAERAARVAALQVRGSGAAAETAYRTQMDVIGGMPGGRDSLAFGTARQRAIGAEMTRFGQEDLGYNLRSTSIHGMQAVLHNMPYSPGNRFALAGADIRNEQGQIAVTEARMSSMRRRGELSEEAEQRMTAELWQMRVKVSQDVGELSEGTVDRLAPLSVGRPDGFDRFDSWNLAAMNYGRAGSPSRRYGAVGGRQARMQDEFAQSMVGVFSTPHSGTEGVNSSLAGGNDRAVEVLQQILRAIQGGGAGQPGGAQYRGAYSGRDLRADGPSGYPIN